MPTIYLVEFVNRVLSPANGIIFNCLWGASVSHLSWVAPVIILPTSPSWFDTFFNLTDESMAAMPLVSMDPLSAFRPGVFEGGD